MVNELHEKDGFEIESIKYTASNGVCVRFRPNGEVRGYTWPAGWQDRNVGDGDVISTQAIEKRKSNAYEEAMDAMNQ